MSWYNREGISVFFVVWGLDLKEHRQSGHVMSKKILIFPFVIATDYCAAGIPEVRTRHPVLPPVTNTTIQAKFISHSIHSISIKFATSVMFYMNFLFFTFSDLEVLRIELTDFVTSIYSLYIIYAKPF